MEKIKKLSLASTLVCDKAMINISKQLPGLIAMNVRDCLQVSKTGILAIVCACRQLQQFDVGYSSQRLFSLGISTIDRFDLSEITSLPNLLHLSTDYVIEDTKPHILQTCEDSMTTNQDNCRQETPCFHPPGLQTWSTKSSRISIETMLWICKYHLTQL